jgi:hypothetical protein
MIKLFSGVFLALIPFLTHAVEGVAEVPAVAADVSPWPLIISATLFLGMIAGFFVFIWRKERERKERETGSS